MLDIFLHLEDLALKLHQKQLQKHLCCYLSRCKYSVLGFSIYSNYNKSSCKVANLCDKVAYPSSIKDNIWTLLAIFSLPPSSAVNQERKRKSRHIKWRKGESQICIKATYLMHFFLGVIREFFQASVSSSFLKTIHL